MSSPFMFATGIENSIPTIVENRERVDEMAKCGHYDHWRRDFELVADLGIPFLRYGPPLHTGLIGPGHFDGSFADETFAELRRLGITPIVDLRHFGVPDWLGDFQNPDFPELFAAYAGAFARRFPWVQLYTPVNEMFVCATFSGKYGWWNERLRSDRGFVMALKHLVKANVLAMHAILAVRPDAIFIQRESSEYFHAETSSSADLAGFLNDVRFLSLDLNYGHRVDSEMYEYLLDNGMTRDEYRFFLMHHLKSHCIMGNDYYATNEHRVTANGGTRFCGEVFGYALITQQYYDRYRLPVAHRDEPVAGRGRPGGGELAVQGVGQPGAAAAERRAHRGLHLVLADRSAGLGQRPAREQRPRQSARPLRPGPQHPPGGGGVPAAHPRLAGRAACC